jgi:hypothetical protein
VESEALRPSTKTRMCNERPVDCSSLVIARSRA